VRVRPGAAQLWEQLLPNLSSVGQAIKQPASPRSLDGLTVGGAYLSKPPFCCSVSHPFWLMSCAVRAGEVEWVHGGGGHLATPLPTAANKWQLADKGRLR
jgi:hypothetical protein